MSEQQSPQEQPNLTAAEAVAAKPAGEQAVAKRPLPTIDVGSFGVELRSLSDLWRFAQIYAVSGLAPKGMQTPEAIAIAVQLGLEVGLHPAQAVQSIAVINGRPAIWGDPQLALVRRSGLLEEFEEWYEHQGKRVDRWPAKPDDTTTAVCRAKRTGFATKDEAFSVADAKVAKLWGKTGRDGQDTPWVTFPSRMLKMRPRGFVLRDLFGDGLKGLTRQAEEVSDYIDTDLAPGEEPIEMPRPAPATLGNPEAAMDAALQEDGTGKIGTVTESKEGLDRLGSGGQPPKYVRDDSAGPHAVKIVNAKRKAGTKPGKTEWTITTSDGANYDTDDLAIYQAIAKFRLEGGPVRIVAEPGTENPRILEVVSA